MPNHDISTIYRSTFLVTVVLAHKQHLNEHKLFQTTHVHHDPTVYVKALSTDTGMYLIQRILQY